MHRGGFPKWIVLFDGQSGYIILGRACPLPERPRTEGRPSRNLVTGLPNEGAESLSFVQYNKLANLLYYCVYGQHKSKSLSTHYNALYAVFA